ncbi:MAG TPA: hypothetical protein VGJ84_03180 [Polyangiaceae bacterium]
MHSSSSEEQLDAPDPLPPLDDEPAADDATPDDFADFGGLFQNFEEDQGVYPEDEAESEIDAGVELHKPLDEEEDDRAETVLDIGVLLRDAVDDGEPEEGDFFGPTGQEPSIGIEEAPPEGLVDEEAAPNGALTDLVLDDLPPLDADDEGNPELPELLIEPTLDNELPALAAEPWEFQRAPLATEPLFTVSVRDSILVSASEHILWFDGGESPVRLDAGGGRLESLCSVASGEAVVYATSSGQIGRRWRAARNPEWLTSTFLAELDERGRDSLAIQLFQPSRDDDQLLLALTSSGKLLRSRDAGTSWTRVETGGLLRAVAVSDSKTFGLLSIGSEQLLLCSDDAGQSWQKSPSPELGGFSACEQLSLVAEKGVLALAAPARALAVSVDEGASFTPLPACTKVTALAIGELDGVVYVFAALFDEPSARTALVLIETPTMNISRIFSLCGPADADDEALEWAWVSQLVWDAGSSRLWGVGGFGLGSWSPVWKRTSN